MRPLNRLHTATDTSGDIIAVATTEAMPATAIGLITDMDTDVLITAMPTGPTVIMGMAGDPALPLVSDAAGGGVGKPNT